MPGEHCSKASVLIRTPEEGAITILHGGCEETGAQRGGVASPGSHSWEEAEVAFEPEGDALESVLLCPSPS